MIPGELRILVCTEPLDMRLGFDRLAAAVRDKLGADPVTGGLYIFSNRGATRLKLLWFDRGFCLLYKRLHGAVFDLPIARDGSCSVRTFHPAWYQWGKSGTRRSGEDQMSPIRVRSGCTSGSLDLRKVWGAA